MSLDSKHNKMKEFKRLLNNFKSLKPLKQEIQLKKERIMKNVDELYKKYYNFYKNDFDNDDELSEAKKKKFDYKQVELFDKTEKELTLDGKTKKNKKPKLTALPKWLYSKNDFIEAIKLIEDIKVDKNNVKPNGDKKVFNDLNELINKIKNSKTKKQKVTINKIRDIVSDLDQLRKKESTVFKNKMIDVVYYLFGINSLGINSKPGILMLQKWIKISKIRFNEMLSTVTKAKNEGLRTNVDGREIQKNLQSKSIKV